MIGVAGHADDERQFDPVGPQSALWMAISTNIGSLRAAGDPTERGQIHESPSVSVA